jgi:hypothetical protein
LHAQRVDLALPILAFRVHSMLDARFRPGDAFKQEDGVANFFRNCVWERTRSRAAPGQQLPQLKSPV